VAAGLNLARTVVRRAERATWAAAASVQINPQALRYLNRLSDLLFILGRQANRLAGRAESLWVPAGERA
jgi:cob(I)alamin adenosyltransferase